MLPEATLLAALLRLGPYSLEPADPTREWRLAQVAGVLAGYPREVAAGVAWIGWPESRYARYVWAGCSKSIVPKRAPNCDEGRALGYWQLHQATCPAAWGFPPWTTESLKAQVACAARLYQGAAPRCLVASGSQSRPQAFGCVWADRAWQPTGVQGILWQVTPTKNQVPSDP